MTDPVEGDDFDLAGFGGEAGDVAVCGDLVVVRLALDIECVKGLFLAGDEHLLGTVHNEIASLVLGALAGLS